MRCATCWWPRQFLRLVVWQHWDVGGGRDVGVQMNAELLQDVWNAIWLAQQLLEVGMPDGDAPQYAQQQAWETCIVNAVEDLVDVRRIMLESPLEEANCDDAIKAQAEAPGILLAQQANRVSFVSGNSAQRDDIKTGGLRSLNQRTCEHGLQGGGTGSMNGGHTTGKAQEAAQLRHPRSSGCCDVGLHVGGELGYQLLCEGRLLRPAGVEGDEGAGNCGPAGRH